MLATNEYYYLIAGLSDLIYGDDKLAISLVEFKQELEEHLSIEDKRLINLIFIKYDNQNIITHLNGKEFPEHNLGNFSFEEIEIACKSPERGDLLEFQLDFIENFKSGDTKPIVEAELSFQYYNYLAENTPNEYLNKWFCFERDVKSLFVALTCRKYGIPIKDQVMGDSHFAKQLQTSNSKDFELSREYHFVEEIIQEFEKIELHEKEQLLDKILWKKLEDYSPLYPFSIDIVLCYLLQLTILERWAKLSSEEGEQKFNETIENLKHSFTFSEPFV